MKKKWIVAVAVLLVLAVGGWYLASPPLAMKGLRDAAVAGDEAELDARIDFPSVREGLKEDLLAQMASEMAASGENDGMEAFGAALGMAFVGPMIDGMVTPEFIGRTVREGRMAGPGNVGAQEPVRAPTDASTAGSRTGEGAGDDDGREIEWEIERDGLSYFRAIPQIDGGSEGAGEPPALVFERDGLSWRLVRIELPDEPARPRND